MFCASYEAMYQHMGTYNSWYSVNGPGIAIDFQAEWKKFIRTALDAAVTRARTAFDNMYQQQYVSSHVPKRQMRWLMSLCTNYSKYAPPASPLWLPWFINNLSNRRFIKLDRVCAHLGRTNVH